MIITLLLCLIVPISIYLCLILIENIPLTLFVYQVLICLFIPIIDIVYLKKKSFKNYLLEIGFRKLKKNLLPSFITGTVFTISIYLIFSLVVVNFINIEDFKLVLKGLDIDPNYQYLFMFSMIISNSLFEEIYWRGYIFNRLKSRTSNIYSIFISSLFYASYHFITTAMLFPINLAIIFTFIVFCAGLLWGFMRNKFDSIYFPVITHLFADLGIMLIYIKLL
ncbi:MAG: CPBP family intramembrane metalloprotease [Spirochaetales bacterium]|nr:CPBP family intramembrane metalloprotease [Spirochaetales bacterium]